MQAEELRKELGEVRAELNGVSVSLEEAEEDLEAAQVALRKAEVAQEEQQQRCLAWHLVHDAPDATELALTHLEPVQTC